MSSPRFERRQADLSRNTDPENGPRGRLHRARTRRTPARSVPPDMAVARDWCSPAAPAPRRLSSRSLHSSNCRATAYAIRVIAKATRAPTAEQTALTTSLSNPWTPAACLVEAPQVWTRRSVDTAHRSHHRRACTVAPSTESVSAPAIPPTATAAKATGQLASVASAAMNIAPATAARLPTTVKPPEVPGGTRFPERIDTGSRATSVPTSVAQVSAVDAAIAPAPSASQSGEGVASCPRAATANTPPFANTCPASRSPPFSTTESTRAAFLLSPTFDSTLAETNSESSNAPQLHPAAMQIVPTRRPAMAPLLESVRVRRAANTTSSESAPPTAVRTTTPVTASYRAVVSRARRCSGLLEGGSGAG